MIFLAVPVLSALVFAMLHIGCSLCRLERRFTIWDAAVLVWSLLYAIFAIWFADVAGIITNGGGPQIQISLVPVTIFIMVPSLITGLLASAAWRQFRLLLVMLLAGIATVAISIWIGMIGMMLIAPAAWIAIYFIACQFCIREINRSVADMLCASCGYSLEGLQPDAVCPECGHARITTQSASS